MNASKMSAPGGALQGRVALVTGGARGIGRAIVNELAGLGATRFTAESEVGDLFPGWTIERVERASHTEGNGQHEIRHLIIHGVKR